MQAEPSPALPAAVRWRLLHLPVPCPPPLLQAIATALAAAPAWQPARQSPPAVPARSTPAEGLRARLIGLPGSDGRVPWAALRALQTGRDPALPWGFVHPCHWALGADHTRLEDPSTLALDEAASRALFDAVQPYFAGDGLTLLFDTPARWLVQGERLRGLCCTSLARAIGQNVAELAASTEPDLPHGGADAAPARWLLRLQSEMQMLLYQHPLHDARQAQGLAPVNSFWLDGTGAWPTGLAPQTLQIDEQTLPADPAALGAALQATLHPVHADAQTPTAMALCGARGVAVLVPQAGTPASWTQRLRAALSFSSSSARQREWLTLLQSL